MRRKADKPSDICPSCADENTGDRIISHGDVRKSINCRDSWHKTVNARMEEKDEQAKESIR